jgi:tetratricopeptide (TPR) repeat protein
MRDKTLSGPIEECRQYLSALETEETGHWRQAFDAFQEYSAAHPNGLFSREAHEHSALVLMHIVRELVTQEQYEEALTNLNMIVSSYQDTSVFAETATLFPSIYTSWGESLCDSRDFEKAELAFVEFKSWSQNNDNELEVDAEIGLVGTYLAWALDLQSQGKFEDALAKLDLAGSVAPESEEVKTGRSDVFVNWGNDLLRRNEFSTAIEKFKFAVSSVEGDSTAHDALASGYVQWASDLSAKEDFLGALDELKMAEAAAVSDNMKQSVDTAFTDTYAAFSSSTGQQARRAMRDALKTICEQKKEPELPIFGLDKDTILAGIYGIEDKLPEDVTAKTPGEMHYVACIKVEERVIDSDVDYEWFRTPERSYIPIGFRASRVKTFWHVTLRKTVDTGEYAAKTFEGGPPPPIPQ